MALATGGACLAGGQGGGAIWRAESGVPSHVAARVVAGGVTQGQRSGVRVRSDVAARVVAGGVGQESEVRADSFQKGPTLEKIGRLWQFGLCLSSQVE